MDRDKPVFFDERQRRWWLTRRTLEVAGVLMAAIIVIFFISIVTKPVLPNFLPAWSHPELHAGPGRATRIAAKRKGRQVRVESLGKIPANYDPLRMAFYVSWDFTSLSSLQQHFRDIDVLVPEKLHATDADGHMNIEADLNLDNWLKKLDFTIPMMPLVNNYDGTNWHTKELAQLLAKPESRKNLEDQLVRYVTAAGQEGIVVDFEEVPETSQDDLKKFITELTESAHRFNKKTMICVPAADSSYDYGYYAKNSDAIILMNYDEHWTTSKPGPITSQEWYMRNLINTLKDVPPERLVMGIANYSYDWPLLSDKSKDKTPAIAASTSFQQALVTAKESETEVYFDEDALNPTFSYVDEKNVTHEVWLLDAVTAYNEERAAERLGVRGTALWRLGSEDPSIWPIWDATRPDDAMRKKIEDMPPGYDLVLEGFGDIWRVVDTPKPGKREFRYDAATDTFTDESYVDSPFPYRIEQIGPPHGDKHIALTFDDGPDPRYTPRILDILKEKNATVTFFITGINANDSPNLLRRIYAEGHEIGNHTYTHPRFDEIPLTQIYVELTLTQRLFESILGIKTLLFRPPYGIDHQPESDSDVRLLPIPQGYGYVLVGSKIDPHDWGLPNGGPPPPATAIVKSVLDQAAIGDGHIVLMHDGGGNRENTVAALPDIIDGLRKRGFILTGVSAQMGQTRAQVMPVLQTGERWTARADALVFNLLHGLRVLFATVFLVGIALISGRAVFIGLLAIIEKWRAGPGEHPEFKPPVTVMIPAYNEQEGIVQTVESVLASDYPNMQIVVVDDGSHDDTATLLDQHFGDNPRILILRQVNQGKPAALNNALAHATGEILITIDADTYIESNAISKLVRNFADARSGERVGAVAGNTKVGNRQLWLTRWQALEYISGQNMEKRAFDVLDCITVVPGAIGAWRASVMRECGGFSRDTVAEDTDLTLAIRRRHWHIRYDDEAIAYTNAPETAGDLIRQRFRWTFGTMQAVWKHRDTLARTKYGTLGWIALPNVFLFQILLPLFSPVIDLLFLGTLLLWGLAQLPIAHIPLFWTTDDVRRSVIFFLAFMVVDFLTCVVAFLLEKDEDWTLLFPIVLQRFYYRQMMYVVLFRALVRALKGTAVGWGHTPPSTQPTS